MKYLINHVQFMTHGFLLNYNYVISKAQIFSLCKNSKRYREDRSVATVLFLFLAPSSPLEVVTVCSVLCILPELFLPDRLAKGKKKILFCKFCFLPHILEIFSCQFTCCVEFCIVQFSPSVMSGSLWPHGVQHARLPCPSPTPRTCSDLSVELMMSSSHLILCHPLLLPTNLSQP